MENGGFCFEMPVSFVNELTRPENGKLFYYAARAWGLHFDESGNIRGGVQLLKQQIITRTGPIRRLKFRKSWRRPFYIETSMETRTRLRLVIEVKSDFNSYHFVFRGFSTDYPDGAYRLKLKGLVRSKYGLELSNELVEMLFRPIDTKCMKLHQAHAKHLSQENEPPSVSDNRLRIHQA